MDVSDIMGQKKVYGPRDAQATPSGSVQNKWAGVNQYSNNVLDITGNFKTMDKNASKAFSHLDMT
jgi:hypothetical protein